MNLLRLTDLYRAVHITCLATSWAAAGHVLGGRALRGPGTIAVLTARLPGPQ
jgi:multisubunit Na+/H+ antiporter MnhG subunit